MKGDLDTRTYDVERRETVAETGALRVRLYTLAAGQEVPWHYHSHVTDTFFCLEGTLSVETRSTETRHLLSVGESCAVPPKTPHRVTGHDGSRVRFLIVQGIGTYDFCPIGEDCSITDMRHQHRPTASRLPESGG